MSAINRHIMWFFGPMKMRDIGTRTGARVDHRAQGPRCVAPADRIREELGPQRDLHHGARRRRDRGRTPAIGSRRIPSRRSRARIITAQQFDAVYAALPNSDAQLLVETAIETGLRWGELTELRVQGHRLRHRRRDGEPRGRLRVPEAPSRRPPILREEVPEGPGVAPVRAERADRPQAVATTPRRTTWVPMTCCSRVAVTSHRDRARSRFPIRRPWGSPSRTRRADGTGTGRRPPTDSGRCRCEHCRHAVALYRAERRRTGKDRPSKGRIVEIDPHLHAGTFRTSVLRPALKAAGIDGMTFHGLRHAHASWLLAGGADIQVVKERLGHAKISTTEGYLHTLPGGRRDGPRCPRQDPRWGGDGGPSSTRRAGRSTS